MKACTACLLLVLWWATTDARGDVPGVITQEQAACIANLKAIYTAIQAYEHDHKALPNWLSDLVPQYLPDMNVLICPVCRRTGETEASSLADPKLPCSYLYEFCPVPLGTAAPNAPNRTRREWKRRQMGLVGSIVPIVRCRHHAAVLNLAFDGSIYESPDSWETLLTNRVNVAELSPARMFADAALPATNPALKAAPSSRFPPRDPNTPPQLLDLTAFYNAALTSAWHGSKDNDLRNLPRGLQTLAGVKFDVRGIVQLRSLSPSSTNFPAAVKSIPVRQKCQRLQFLHAAGFGNAGDDGKQIGTYVVHFASNPMRLEIPIRYGHEVRDWHSRPGEPPPPKDLTQAWEGQNPASKSAGHSIRLFLTTWTNLAPNLEISSIDYVSSMAGPAPFLIAITAE
ncbi:MAG TPA: hypothetical protein VMU04_04020 [Candidatus Acidoferrum sp.]|nr:hypothetical protein [Candidatus Acidoferrum sp.]